MGGLTDRQTDGQTDEWLTLNNTMPVLTNLRNNAIESIVGIGENAGNQHFLLFLVCLWFYAVSTVFQLFNGDSSQIHISFTIFNQYITNPLS